MGQWPADHAGALGLAPRLRDRVERPLRVTEPVLAEHRHLDPGDDPARSPRSRDRPPGRLGFAEPAEPAQDSSALDLDPLGRPGILEAAASIEDRPRPAGRRCHPRPAAEVRTTARPPPPIEDRVLVERTAVLAPEGVGKGIRPIERRVEALERLVQPPGARERSREPGEVAVMGPCALIGRAKSRLEVSEEPREGDDVLVVMTGDVREERSRPSP